MRKGKQREGKWITNEEEKGEREEERQEEGGVEGRKKGRKMRWRGEKENTE